MPSEKVMKFRLGYELRFEFVQPTPVIMMLQVHDTRASDLEKPDIIGTAPQVAMSPYMDTFGNRCCRLVAPAGEMKIWTDTVASDDGLPDRVAADASQVPVESLPDDALLYLLASRYCDSDLLSKVAWTLFAHIEPGWARVQAICDFVHEHITFDYRAARPSRTALGAYEDQRGVCRDYAHLAIALCRALNVPARYCTGYLSDVGTPKPYPAGDFAAWFEAYLGGQWHTFDPRNNVPRIGRFLIARGRDAADVAMTTTFGANTLSGFRVWTDEIACLETRSPAAASRVNAVAA
jgi:transglutaminase-like putative cysteine protease